MVDGRAASFMVVGNPPRERDHGKTIATTYSSLLCFHPLIWQNALLWPPIVPRERGRESASVHNTLPRVRESECPLHTAERERDHGRLRTTQRCKDHKCEREILLEADFERVPRYNELGSTFTGPQKNPMR